MVEIRNCHPKQIDRDEWQALQVMQWAALREILDPGVVTDAQLDVLVGMDDPGRYVDSHLDPNTEVGRRFNANNLYKHSRVAVAYEHDDPVGFIYAANNTSGGGPAEGPHNTSRKAQAIRNGKRLIPAKNHFWVREIAVDPSHQRTGVAKKLARSIFSKAGGFQDSTTWIWPELVPFLRGNLESLGFVAIGNGERQQILGPGSDDVLVLPMHGRAATILNGLYRD